MKLYHFTHAERLPLIEAQGIAKGDVPTTPQGGFNAPWFTSEESFDQQAWSMSVDKTGVRLTVEFPEDDPKLKHWPELAQAEGIEQWWYDSLDKVGGGGSDDWYVYRGTVPWSWVVAVDYKVLGEFGLGKTLKSADR